MAAFGVLTYLFWPLLDEFQAAGVLFRTAQWAWLPLIVLIQVISFAFLTWLNLLGLQPFPGRVAFWRMAGILTAMAFIEVAIPSAGASGIALRARLLSKHGRYSLGGSTFSLILENFYIGAAMASVGAVGLIYLLRSGDLRAQNVYQFAFIALIAAGTAWSGWRLLRSERWSYPLLRRLARGWNRIAGRFFPLDLEILETRRAAFQAQLSRLDRLPNWKFWLAAYGRVVFDAATLGACFSLFHYTIPLGTLLTGYALTLLLSGVASLPGGLGMADVSAPVIFARLGTPGSVALAAGLTYRAIAYWLVRFIGFICWQLLEAADGEP